MDDVAPKVEATTAVQTIEHGSTNHPRSEHQHRPEGVRASTEGPAPRPASLAGDLSTLLEQLRNETKADNLYYLRAREREQAEPREDVIDAINQRLREVQGEPIHDQ